MTSTARSLPSDWLERVRQALHQGRADEAKSLAEAAAREHPDLETPWLILAALSEPHQSIAYLERALAINPHSRAARQGMHWAVRRLRQTQIKPSSASTYTFNAPIAEALAQTQPVPIRRPRPAVRTTPPAQAQPRIGSRWRPWLWLALSVFVISGLALAAWSISPQLRIVFARSPSLARPAAALPKPTLTPTATATPTPTPTATPTSTATPSPTPTDTPTPLSTDTPTTPPRADAATWPEVEGDERWIDVDLSEQMVYAYEGQTLVNQFLVSTGTWRYPTVTGQYRIYVKYRYADMRGPGYYLPDVPYVMYFYKGYGLHGTYWHNNFGTPMSHGCINLRTEDAAWLFNWASVGTLVNIHD
ncbi:MAG: L,D-transpeptidase family protein [Thermanaerothrix sp.]|uniref:L,D-transpeptidase n=1 Tax=Thermanaerothrix sp. TaxID=2972675 RepID=UPI003C7C0D56